MTEASTPPWLHGAMAGATLADQLKQAWVHAGRPNLGDLGDRVGYSKATISKVLAGKTPPAWHLVRKLGLALGVPADVVSEQWHPLWVAAANFRRGVPDSRPTGNAPGTGSYTCERCGSWVVNTQLHAEWHARVENQWDADTLSNGTDWVSLRDAVSRRDRP
jgi:transcriptional regulator with XRE-family HTH domain